MIFKFKKHHGHWFDRGNHHGGHWLGYDGKPRWQDRDAAGRWLQDRLGAWGNR